MADHVISPPEAALAAPFEHSRRQLEALLEVSEAIAQQRDLPALFHDLAARLHTVIDFDFLTLVLHDPAKNVMRLHVLETRIPSEKPTGSESAVEGHPSGCVWQTQQPFVFSDIEAALRFLMPSRAFSKFTLWIFPAARVSSRKNRSSLWTSRPPAAVSPLPSRSFSAVPKSTASIPKSFASCAAKAFRPSIAFRSSPVGALSARSISPAAAPTHFLPRTSSCSSKSPRNPPSPSRTLLLSSKSTPSRTSSP